MQEVQVHSVNWNKGYVRCRTRGGRKVYVPFIRTGDAVPHNTHRVFNSAGEAIAYRRKVLDRYRRLELAALMLTRRPVPRSWLGRMYTYLLSLLRRLL